MTAKLDQQKALFRHEDDRPMRLEKWRVVGAVVHGRIYFDEKGRFANGSPIYTSAIVMLDRHSRILRTKNSTYVLGEEIQ